MRTTTSPTPTRFPADGFQALASLGDLLDAGDPVVVESLHGTVVCMSPAAYTELLLTARKADPHDGSGDDHPVPSVVRLTPRELEVLRTAAEGGTTAAIAFRLGVAPNTVAQHLVAVRRKYHVRTTSAAVDRARVDGLVSSDR